MAVSKLAETKHNMLQHKLLTGAAVVAGLVLVAKYLAAGRNAFTADYTQCNREAVSPVFCSKGCGGIDARHEWNSLLWTMIMP